MVWRTINRGGNWPRYRTFWPSGSVWRDMQRLRRQMDQLFDGQSVPTRTSFPAMNAWVGDEGVVVTAELPGVDPDSIQITVVGETLTLSGSRDAEELPEGASFHRRERGYGNFTRTLELPFRVDPDKVDAAYRNGVLHIELPRLPEDKPKKITVKSD